MAYSLFFKLLLFIYIFLAPAIKAITPTQVIIEGVEVTLDCEVSNSSRNEVIAWYHEGVIISRADILLMRNHGYSLDVVEGGSTNHWVITISNVNSTRDAGNWTCVLAPDIALQEESTQLFIVKCPDCETGRNATQILQGISEIPLTEQTVVGVSENIATVVAQEISAADVVLVSGISSRIADLNYTSEKILDSAATIASNLADVDMVELQESEEQADAVSHFVQAFERQLSNVELDDGESINITRRNVALRIASVAADDLSEGLIITLDLPSSNTRELTRSNIDLHTALDFNDRDQRENFTAQVDIPSGISSTVSSTPPTDLETQSNGSDYPQLVFNIYSSPSLFISRSLRNISESSDDFNRSANTLVLSLSIGERKVEMVNELINFTFTPLEPGLNPVCSFWDEDLPDWSQDGCQLLSTTEMTSHTVPYDDNDIPQMSNASGFGRVVCGCNHLTSFAVLMDIYHIEHEYEHINRIFSYIGCGISIVSLTIAVGILLSQRLIRRKQQAKILICLCLSLLALYITFTVMLALDSTRNHREVSQVPCAILTALIHFSLLSSMAWMGVEGFNIYVNIIKIFNSYIPTFMQKATLVAWGIPALIVIATGAISRQYYSHYDRCFLQLWSQIGGLLIPVAIILLINTVIFVLVIVQLIRSTNVSGRVIRDAKIERRDAVLRVKRALCFFVVLGLTWISGFFLLIEEINEVAEAFFIALNSIQGLLILILHGDLLLIFRKSCTCCRSEMQAREAVSGQLNVSGTPLPPTDENPAAEPTSDSTSEQTSVENIDSVVDDGEGVDTIRFRPNQDGERDDETLPPAFIILRDAIVWDLSSLQNPQRFSYY